MNTMKYFTTGFSMVLFFSILISCSNQEPSTIESIEHEEKSVFMTNDEIENLIQIFNNDIDEQDRKKIEKIVKKLSVIGKYSLKKDSQIIDVTAKINLSNIWK